MLLFTDIATFAIQRMLKTSSVLSHSKILIDFKNILYNYYQGAKATFANYYISIIQLSLFSAHPTAYTATALGFLDFFFCHHII
jgi:hypothetical protein